MSLGEAMEVLFAEGGKEGGAAPPAPRVEELGVFFDDSPVSGMTRVPVNDKDISEFWVSVAYIWSPCLVKREEHNM